MPNLNDALFLPKETSPFEPGACPFRLKGNSFLNDFGSHDQAVPGGSSATIARIADPRVKEYCQRTFVVSEWTDVYAGAIFDSTGARLSGLGFERFMRGAGKYQAQINMRGVYGALLRVIGEDAIARWAPRMAGIYFDFGKFETSVVAPNEVLCVSRGIPGGLVQWLAFSSLGFTEEALMIAGAKRADSKILEPTPDGNLYGQALWRLPVLLRWK